MYYRLAGKKTIKIDDTQVYKGVNMKTKTKRQVLKVYRCIVGKENGFFYGEGNEQWYYTLALSISLMICWMLTEIAPILTILAIVHYMLIAVYGYFELSEKGALAISVFWGLQLAVLTIAILLDFKWTIITIVVVACAILCAPDYLGHNIFFKRKVNSNIPLVFNTIIFLIFIIVDFLLPVKLVIKFLFIGIALICHPVIDYLEIENVLVTNVIIEMIEDTKKLLKK